MNPNPTISIYFSDWTNFRVLWYVIWSSQQPFVSPCSCYIRELISPNVINTFFLIYSGIPKCYPLPRFFDGPIFGYFYNVLSFQHCTESIPAVQYFLFTVIFFAVPSTTLSSLRSLFYNPFISIKFKGATKTFAPTIMTTTTESTTICLPTRNTTSERTTIGLTTEIDVHIWQWKGHKKTKDNTQKPSVYFPAFLSCQITKWCLRGCMIEQFIWHSTSRAHSDYGFWLFFQPIFCCWSSWGSRGGVV